VGAINEQRCANDQRQSRDQQRSGPVRGAGADPVDLTAARR
jgi:hypothetical protein